MRLRDDDRAQSVQIGAVLLFAMLVVAFSSYQAFVVPNQNRAVEFNHNQDIRDQMQDLRNELVSIHGETATRSVTLALGTRYPARLVAVNPGPASGTIRTSGTADSGANLTIANATASGETGDFWNGTGRRYDTGFLVYQPSYNVYGQAPETAYENTVLSNRFADESLAATGQTMIDGKRISLVTINGSLSRTRAGSTSLDLEPVSTSTTTVAVSNDSSNVTLSAATQLSESEWDALLADQRDENGGHVLDYEVQPIAGARYDRLSVTLEPNVSYRLRMTKVGVGSQVTAEDEAYLTDAAGNATRLETGDTTAMTLELRDAYNNPVTDGQINASAESGTLSPDQAATDENGQATFTYDSSGVAGGQWVDLQFSAVTEPATSFDGTTPRNVTMRVYVRDASQSNGTASGAYRVSWANPDDATANDGDALSSCSTDACTWDVGASDDDVLTLNSTLSPPYDGVALEYAVSNATVATVSPGSATTGPSGSAVTDLSASANGTLNVLASGNDGSDTIEISVENLTAGTGSATATRTGITIDEAGTRAKDELVALETDGGTATTYTRPGPPFDASDARGIGPLVADLDGDGDLDFPWIDNSNRVAIVDDSENEQTFGQSQQNSRLAVGDFDGDSITEIYYATSGNQLGQASGQEGSQQLSVNSYPNARSVAGIADIDGDDEDELVFTTNNNAINYVDDDGSTIEQTGYGQNLPNGVSIGNPADFDGDGTARIPIVTSSNQIALVDVADGGSVSALTTGAQAAKAPIAATDIDGDGGWEIAYVDTSNRVRYAETDGTTTPVSADGQPLEAEKENGVT